MPVVPLGQPGSVGLASNEIEMNDRIDVAQIIIFFI